jgi:adiponectin receptor
VYLTFISVFAITVFLYSFTPDFHSPPNRKLRGTLFLTLGLSTGFPLLHLALFGSHIAGFEFAPTLLFWYLGGISYVTGALIYINRIPERFRPGRYDIWGSSHQIFHCFVVLGVMLHYVGCLEAYYYRIAHACPA